MLRRDSHAYQLKLQDMEAANKVIADLRRVLQLKITAAEVANDRLLSLIEATAASSSGEGSGAASAEHRQHLARSVSELRNALDARSADSIAFLDNLDRLRQHLHSMPAASTLSSPPQQMAYHSGVGAGAGVGGLSSSSSRGSPMSAHALHSNSSFAHVSPPSRQQQQVIW
jgi:hypothetical protein